MYSHQITELKAEFDTARREWTRKEQQWQLQQQAQLEKMNSMAREMAILKKSILKKRIVLRRKKKASEAGCNGIEQTNDIT